MNSDDVSLTRAVGETPLLALARLCELLGDELEARGAYLPIDWVDLVDRDNPMAGVIDRELARIGDVMPRETLPAQETTPAAAAEAHQQLAAGSGQPEYPCNAPGCSESFPTARHRGQHRRRAHPGAAKLSTPVHTPVEDVDDLAARRGLDPEPTLSHTEVTPEQLAAARLCACGHGWRIHEPDDDTGRGECARRECGCTQYREAVR